MIFLVAHARSHVCKFVGNGYCSSAPEVLNAINEACRRLMDTADYPWLRRVITFNTTRNVIALPYMCETILRDTVDCAPARVVGPYYQFIESGQGVVCNNDSVQYKLEDIGTSPLMFDLPGNGYSISAFSSSNADVGKSISIRGWKRGGESLTTGGVDGGTLIITRWKDGVPGRVRYDDTLKKLDNVEGIHYVYKPITEDYITLHAIDLSGLTKDSTATASAYFLAKYHPQEITPGFRRYRILGWNQASTEANQPCLSVRCLVRLRYVPAVSDADPLLIQNLDAIKLAVQSIKHENEYRLDMAVGYFNRAIQTLYQQMLTNDRACGNELEVEENPLDGVINKRL